MTKADARTYETWGRGRGRWSKIVAILTCLGVASCTAISIEPTCPDELRVGESGPLAANARDAGAIGNFLWEVFPEDAGTIINPQSADAQFEAMREVGAVLRLTASDGLFQVISQCTTQIEGFLGVAVALAADLSSALVGETVTLTCSNDGTVEPAIVAISQESGVIVELTEVSPGVWTFVPTDIGDLTFRCVGESDLGVQSEAVTVTVSVTQTPPPDDGGSGNGTDNANGNVNDNDNANDNSNDNGNGAENENSNVNENSSDNTNDNGGRRPPR